MPETELDAYERMLGRVHGPDVPAQDNERLQPSILSTLSTTERTVGPDGTVTTKVVFKKRFADGTEESSETVHTSRLQEDSSTSHQAAIRREEERKKTGGWFWSN